VPIPRQGAIVRGPSCEKRWNEGCRPDYGISWCSPSGQFQRYARPWQVEEKDTTHAARFADILGKGMVVTHVPWVWVKANDRVGDRREIAIFHLFFLDNPFRVGIF
jgi:hypothetical protein